MSNNPSSLASVFVSTGSLRIRQIIPGSPHVSHSTLPAGAALALSKAGLSLPLRMRLRSPLQVRKSFPESDLVSASTLPAGTLLEVAAA